MKPKISGKKLTTVQIRIRLQDKSRWKALASIYAGGNLSLLIGDAMEHWPRRYLTERKKDRS